MTNEELKEKFPTLTKGFDQPLNEIEDVLFTRQAFMPMDPAKTRRVFIDGELVWENQAEIMVQSKEKECSDGTKNPQ